MTTTVFPLSCLFLPSSLTLHYNDTLSRTLFYPSILFSLVFTYHRNDVFTMPQKTGKETFLWLVINRYCSRSQLLVICPKTPDQGNLSLRCCMTFFPSIQSLWATVFLPAHIDTKHIQYARQSLSQLIDSVTSILNNSTCQLVNKEIIYWLLF